MAEGERYKMETLPARVDLQELQSLAQLMIESKMFTDVPGVAQGAVRILAGRELGIGPVASLRNIEIVRGNLSIRSHLMAAMIKRSPRYNYRVTLSTDEKCIIEFLEDGELCGPSEFTLDDAKRANLTNNDSWKRYPKIMLYNRAMSQGAKMYCPDIFLGGVFYENELIEAEATPVAQDRVDAVRAQEPEPELATERQMRLLYGKLKACGVRDGHKRTLIDFAYPTGLSKRSATEMIDYLSDEHTLPSWLRTPYVRFLVKTHELDRKVVAEYMDKTFNHHDPTLLDQEQFLALVEYLIPKPEPEPEQPEEPDDIYLPGELVAPPTVAEWMKIIDRAKVSSTRFTEWAFANFANGPAEDLTKLPREVYNSINAMADEKIMHEVQAFESQEEMQEALPY